MLRFKTCTSTKLMRALTPEAAQRLMIGRAHMMPTRATEAARDNPLSRRADAFKDLGINVKEFSDTVQRDPWRCYVSSRRPTRGGSQRAGRRGELPMNQVAVPHVAKEPEAYGAAEFQRRRALLRSSSVRSHSFHAVLRRVTAPRSTASLGSSLD
jgi:hypothetical protein